VTDFFSVLHGQRACRRFDANQEVPDDDIESILGSAVCAPSAENTQPWVFVIVRDVHTRAAITELWMSGWAAGGADYVRGHASQRVFEDVNQGIAGGGFAAAPVIVVVGADTRLVAEAFAPSVDLPVGTELALGRKRQGLRILHDDRVDDLFRRGIGEVDRSASGGTPPRSRLSGSTTETTRSTASAPRP